ncbi:tripartite tricarboxylate transporter TctB family protein [Dysosmobacter sp.]|uniref:tripartite tricarboxylate transporter TctB family protein n=1 Tax=Dysosmobacter sp. TaxID=2591382 RepID=UPI003AB21776
MKKANYIISLITVVIGLFFLVYGRQYTGISLDGITSSASWPNILSWLLIFMGVILAIYNSVSKFIPASKIDYKSYEFRCLMLVVAMIVVLLLVWYYFGTLTSLALFLPALCYFLGERRWLVLAAYDIGVVLFIWLVFEKLLNSPLAKPFFL